MTDLPPPPPGYVPYGTQPPPGYQVQGYPQQSAYPQPYYPQGYYVPVRPWNGLAIAGFVISLVPYLWWLGAILSGVALSQVKRTGEQGRGLALAGLIIGCVLTGIVLLVFLMIGLFAATAAARYS
ncbi:MAG TPA: DUF4190 domain-containing protein [Microbacteriaceae bacterium]|nr:DUF4190 domain-containing protein [Microbacteriaceae bacterium]